ncbi:MAG: MFS transporter, partial [Thermomicrobiaceae bacterium]|nr:MFS transporter [Thermomicrobiaceae bacterium]
MAFLPTLIDREELPEGNSRLQASASAAQVVGPGMAGALVGLISAPLALLVDAASFLASAGLIAGIRAEEPAPAPPAARRPVRREIAEGLRAVLGNPVLRAMAGASATTSLFGYVFLAVYVLYLTDDLGLGPTAVGLVFGCGGFGALLGALLAAPAARRFGLGPTIIGARFLFGLGGLTIVLAVSIRPLALPMVLASEFSQWLTLVVADVNQLSLRQAITPDRLQGRV